MGAKLRAVKTDDNLLLLKTNMGAGHGGQSGRWELREVAEAYAFVLRGGGQRSSNAEGRKGSNGISVLRIPALHVLQDMEAVLRQIVADCGPLHHPAAPGGPPPLQGGIG
jgi:hypothetical protein